MVHEARRILEFAAKYRLDSHTTTRLVDAFQIAGGRRVIGVGTCAEYEWSDDRCVRSHAAASYIVRTQRRACRLLTGMCWQRNIEFVWARIFFLFGTGEASQRLIPSLVEALEGRRSLFSRGRRCAIFFMCRCCRRLIGWRPQRTRVLMSVLANRRRLPTSSDILLPARYGPARAYVWRRAGDPRVRWRQCPF